MADVPAVYAAIRDVMADIGQTGIAKGRKNQQQGYNFRGIDDVYNELNSLLSKHSLVIVPRILTRDVVERQTQKGGALFYVTVEAEFDLISAKDGSKHTVRTLGEAMDSGDKATNKAMSAAYKYAAMMLFCIPTEGDNDADFQTHDVAPSRQVGYRNDGTRTSYALKKEQPELMPELARELSECKTLVSLGKLREEWRKKATAEKWNKSYLDAARDRIEGREREIMDEMDRLTAASPDELADLPPHDAFEHSVAMNPLLAG
jgi:hypothetical protein